VSRYDTDPPEDVRDRYRRALDEATGEAADALDGPGQRNAYRMHFTLGQIESALDGVDYTADRRSARTLARIRARLDAYYSTVEGRDRD
jgi:hypothetical protein